MKKLLVSFFGPSGSGKSTCYRYAESFLSARGYCCHNLNVAFPLRRIQSYAHEVFGNGRQNPLDADFKQDGKLLGFLAKHFEDRLGLAFEKNIQVYLDENKNKKIAIINTDCRNNTHETLGKMGFIFIKVETSEDELSKRRHARGDLTLFDQKSSVEQYGEIKETYSVPNSGTYEDLNNNVCMVLDKILKGQPRSRIWQSTKVRPKGHCQISLQGQNR